MDLTTQPREGLKIVSCGSNAHPLLIELFIVVFIRYIAMLSPVALQGVATFSNVPVAGRQCDNHITAFNDESITNRVLRFLFILLFYNVDITLDAILVVTIGICWEFLICKRTFALCYKLKGFPYSLRSTRKECRFQHLAPIVEVRDGINSNFH